MLTPTQFDQLVIMDWLRQREFGRGWLGGWEQIAEVLSCSRAAARARYTRLLRIATSDDVYATHLHDERSAMHARWLAHARPIVRAADRQAKQADSQEGLIRFWHQHAEIGRLDWTGDRMTFSGTVDASAEAFLRAVCEKYRIMAEQHESGDGAACAGRFDGGSDG
jgi:hypothetical protein